MDWADGGRIDEFIYTRVSSETLEDVGVLDGIQDGGEIRYNDLTSIKVSGKIPYLYPPEIGNDYIRVYSVSTLGQEVERIAHGTFIAASPASIITGARNLEGRALKQGELDLYSLLLILEQKRVTVPYQIDQGIIAVSRAASLVSECSLPVVVEDSSAALISPATFDAGTSYLEIINWLLQYAGFDTAEIDGYGNVRLVRYQDPANLSPAITFEDNAKCVFAPEISHDFDLLDVPNQVIAVMSNQDVVLTATATNDDPDNQYSTVSRGRVIAHVEEVSQVSSQEELDAYALRVLQSKTSSVESIIITHVYQPFLMGQGGRALYSRAYFDFVGTAVSQSLKLSKGIICSTRFRKFVRF